MSALQGCTGSASGEVNRRNDDLPCWTAQEIETLRRGLLIGPIKSDWRGRYYRQFTSLAKDNIYRETFSWREYEKAF